MEIKRIDEERDINRQIKRITIEHGGREYVITPEYTGLRIHQSGFDDGLKILPSCSNEIIVI